MIVVDDGSTDGGTEFIREFVKDHKEFRLLENEHLGKAEQSPPGCWRHGANTGSLLTWIRLLRLRKSLNCYHFFEDKADVVIGSRSTRRQGSPLIRRFISRAQIILRKMIIGLPGISDTQCGFKMFRGEVAEQLFTAVKKNSQRV